jgi:hypothetical protein
MATAKRELRAAQNQLLFRTANDRLSELGENVLNSMEEVEFACECENHECTGSIRMRVGQFAAIEGVENRFIVLRGHEEPDVEYTVAERDGFLIVSKHGTGAGLVKKDS